MWIPMNDFLKIMMLNLTLGNYVDIVMFDMNEATVVSLN